MITQNKRNVSSSFLVKRWNVVSKTVLFNTGLTLNGDVWHYQHVYSVFQYITFTMFYVVCPYLFLCNFLINQLLAATFFLVAAHERMRFRKLFYFCWHLSAISLLVLILLLFFVSTFLKLCFQLNRCARRWWKCKDFAFWKRNWIAMFRQAIRNIVSCILTTLSN